MPEGMFRLVQKLYGGFPKLGVPLWVVPIIRIVIFWDLYWGPPILGNYHIGMIIGVHSHSRLRTSMFYYCCGWLAGKKAAVSAFTKNWMGEFIPGTDIFMTGGFVQEVGGIL